MNFCFGGSFFFFFFSSYSKKKRSIDRLSLSLFFLSFPIHAESYLLVVVPSFVRGNESFGRKSIIIVRCRYVSISSLFERGRAVLLLLLLLSVIVGGGSAGITAAKLIGKTLQKSVALVEQERMGGDCTWTGCIPSKSLLAVAKEIHAARKWGLVTTLVNFQAIREQIQSNIQQIYDEDDSPEAMKRYGVEIVSGSAILSPSGKSVQVTKPDGSNVTLTAKKGIILCTGAAAKVPRDIAGLEEVPFVTTESIWSLETLPQRLTVVGGGPVGCELAQAFARLGSQVTLIAPTLLPAEDPQVSLTLEQVFASEGIQRVSGRAVSAASSASGSSHTIQVQRNDGSTEQVVGDTLLLALGRVPRVEGLAEAGIRLNAKGGIEVNSKLQTSVKHVYAAGDCTGDRQL